MHSPAGNTTQLVLGFPIRTSSDQRTVGNSPRLNAASHVLHRPSMPRHPPYARNTKQQLRSLQKTADNSTNKNYTKRTRCSRPLYSSHTTHTPRRPTTTTGNQPTMECHNKEHTMLPQTPNSMPTHHQFHCCTNVLSVVHPSVHTPQPHPILTSSMMIVVGCVSTRTFLKQTGGSTTLGYSTTTPTTVGEK